VFRRKSFSGEEGRRRTYALSKSGGGQLRGRSPGRYVPWRAPLEELQGKIWNFSVGGFKRGIRGQTRGGWWREKKGKGVAQGGGSLSQADGWRGLVEEKHFLRMLGKGITTWTAYAYILGVQYFGRLKKAYGGLYMEVI